MVAFETHRLTSALGARITGLPRVDTIDDATLTELVAAVHEHLVVFVDGQHELTDAGHLDVMSRIGSPYVHPLMRVGGHTDAIVEHIVDDEAHPPFQDRWHTDVSWDLEPPAIGSLRPIEMPDHGGDTLWASMYAAHDTLSPAWRALLEGTTAHHDIGSGEAFKTKGGVELFEMAKRLLPDTRHPVVGVHPTTGRRYLYVNRQFTRRIVELTPAESDAVLGHLVEHAVRPHHCLRHRWTVGELCLWDERATQHFATADHFPARREMARVAVGDPV